MLPETTCLALTNSYSGIYMLSPLRIRKLTRYFNCIDADGNGYFERADIDLIGARLAKIRGFAVGSDEYNAIVGGLDQIWQYAREFGVSKNENSVSLLDWLAHEAHILSDEELKESYMRKITRDVFDLVDFDGNGTISLEEYTQLMTAFGVEEGLPEWSFRKIDLDGSGEIEKDEFVQIVEEFHMSENPRARGNYLFGPY